MRRISSKHHLFKQCALDLYSGLPSSVNSTWLSKKGRNSCYCTQSHDQEHIIKSKYPDISVPDVNYGEFVLQNAHKYLDNVAVIDGITGEKLTYSDLLESRKSVASGLIKLGLHENDRVCICMKNSPQFVMAFIGTMSANLVVSPVNPACTKEELTRQVTISGSKALIIDQDCVNQGILTQETASQLKKVIIVKPTGSLPFSSMDFDKLLVDDGSAYGRNSDTSDVKSGGHWMNKLAILPYSSGTTGLPKGVMLSHGNMTSNLLQQKAAMDNAWRPEDVVLGLLPLYHLYCSGVILPRALFSGAKFISLPKFDPATFIEKLSEHKVSVCHLVPPLIHFLNNSPKTKTLDLSTISELFSAAAPLDAHQERLIKETLHKRNPNVYVAQGYGLTETSPLVTFNPQRYEVKPMKQDKTGSVGILVPNQEAKVVCPEKLTPCKAIEPGELWVRGPNIMQGYLDNQKATEECLLPGGWFRTGDIGYYDEDHYFYIVDRLKEFIKYNAYQVAPAELEGILRSHVGVADCAVVGKPHPESGELPTAFIVLRDKSSSGPSMAQDIIDFVKERVSSYKQLRGGVIFVDAIPKSPSGKILRRNLRATL